MSELTVLLSNVLEAYLSRRAPAKNDHGSVVGETAWNMQMSFELPEGDLLVIRPLQNGDERLLCAFRDELTERSRDLFCPYPWDDEVKLLCALEAAVSANVKHVDASYLILAGERPVGHCFLWKAGGNAHSLRSGVQIPELGVAISDAFQQRGLGYLAVQILKAIAKDLGSDAIELTTALTNDGGWNTYVKSGFAFQGMIKNPLEVDVTAVAAGQTRATRYREERQMVYVINEAKRKQVLEYLARKRDELVH